MKKVEHMDNPVNATERFLYAIALRLEIIIDQLSGLSDHIANQSGTTTESNVVKEAQAVVEEVKEVVAPKRKSTKK